MSHPARCWLAGVVIAGALAPWTVAAQTQPVMIMGAPVQVTPMTLIPLTPVTLIPLTPVQPIPAQPVMTAPVMAPAPVMATPVVSMPMAPTVADPDDPPGNMLSRLIARIHVGDPDEPPTPETVRAVPVVLVPAAPTPQGIYTVRSGGTLAAVARRTGATLDDLRALNPTIPAGHRLDKGAQVWLPFPWPQ